MRSSFTYRKKIITLLLILISASFIHAKEAGKWIIAAQKFNFSGKEKESVKEGISSMLPQRILENISKASFRTIYVNEVFERELYKLKNERTSLFLQLSAEIQRRDSLVLQNFSKDELKKQIENEEKKIAEIKKQIDENLLNQAEYEEKIARAKAHEVYKDAHNENQIEKIEIYKNDYSALYNVPDNLLSYSYDSREIEKDVFQNGINALLTGRIKAYGEYISVTVELYNYPGGKSVACVTEYGSLDEADIIASSIVRQLAPQITNSLPCELKFVSDIPLKEVSIYIDDVLQKNINGKLKLDSGIHHLEFVCKDYNTASCDYYFEGNQSYEVKFNLQKKEFLDISLVTKVEGQGIFYTDGKPFEGQIEINGKPVLGLLYGGKKNSDFFILDDSILEAEQTYVVDANLEDKNDYIENRRRWMYTSYSILITSLIPSFYLNGQALSYSMAGQKGYLKTSDKLEEANRWILASDISTGISIGLGVWFVYELVRYLYAANSILPKKADPAPLDFNQTKEADKEEAAVLPAEDGESAQDASLEDEKIQDKNTDTKNTEKNIEKNIEHTTE